MFWPLVFFLTVAISILFVNPAPFLVCLALWGLARPSEEPLEAAIKEDGRNPDLPPMPTSGVGAAGCLFWLLSMGVVLLLVAAVVGGVVYGGGV